ncbi:MAG: phytoene dehydrogenase-like protein [Glaciecola sp.]|uniref:phytoene desaturase family protein n=1 Tax=Congregibacter sp. TaxID=2744308 RepID=UPI0039E5947B
MSTYDTIIIGAGHNGLICATLLARAGQRVLVLEANDRVGGLAADREFHPGFHASVAQSFYALSSDLVKDLKLAQHGFELSSNSLNTVALSLGESPVIIAEHSVSGVSADDSSAYQKYRDQLRTFAAALSPFWAKTMPGIGGNTLKELFTFAHMGLKLRMMGKDDMLEFLRVASLPMRDLVDEHFESDALKAALCWDGLIGSKLAPRSPNQAVLTLLNRMAGAHNGQHSLPSGGVRAFVGALKSAAENAGVDIRLESAVKKVRIDGDENGQRCSGVLLANGESIDAPRVVSNADPKTTFLKLVGTPHLEIEFSNRIRRLRCDGFVAKLHLALSDLPGFTGVDRPDGRIIIAPNMDSIEFAFDDAKYGDSSENPVLEVLIPSLQQQGLAPSGQHVLSAQVMYVPAHPNGGWDADRRQALIERLLALLESYAPGIKDLVLGAELLTPADLEDQYQLSNGHWHHAEPAIDQLLMMRPTYEAAQYRTPIDGLYLCGAGSHPGGDLTGNPGRNAAREILA